MLPLRRIFGFDVSDFEVLPEYIKSERAFSECPRLIRRRTSPSEFGKSRIRDVAIPGPTGNLCGLAPTKKTAPLKLLTQLTQLNQESAQLQRKRLRSSGDVQMNSVCLVIVHMYDDFILLF